MPRTYTEQALHIVDSLRKIAKRDHTVCRSRGFSFHENGHIYLDEDRIGHAAAVQSLAAVMEKEELAIEEDQKTHYNRQKEQNQRANDLGQPE